MGFMMCSRVIASALFFLKATSSVAGNFLDTKVQQKRFSPQSGLETKGHEKMDRARRKIQSARRSVPDALDASIVSCLAYGLLSTTITFFNKAIFAVYLFHYPVFLTLVQVVLSILFMTALRISGTLDFGPPLSWSSARHVVPVSLLWMTYVQSGVIALHHLTVPMFAVLRRSTTVLTVVGQWIVLGKKTSLPCLCATGCMLLGTLIAGASDLSFSFEGYVWVSVCVVSTAAYLILISYLGDRMKMNQHAMLFYNNVFSLPMILAWMFFFTDEPSTVLNAPQLRSREFQGFLLISASQAFFLNVCIFWCTTVNSPMATTVTGQVKDVATTGLGLFIFGDVTLNVQNIVGVVMGVAGGVSYSFFSLKKQGVTATAARIKTGAKLASGQDNA